MSKQAFHWLQFARVGIVSLFPKIAHREVSSPAPRAGDLLTAGLDDKTQEKLRYEILAQTSEYSVEFSSVVTQIGVFMSFGCAWPLSAFAILIGVFVISQMDVWKFNVITQVGFPRAVCLAQLHSYRVIFLPLRMVRCLGTWRSQ